MTPSSRKPTPPVRRAALLATLVAAALATTALAATAAGATPLVRAHEPDPLRPKGAEVFVAVHDAAAILADPAILNVAASLVDPEGVVETVAAWRGLARTLGYTPVEAIERLLAGRVTLALLPGDANSDRPARRWLATARVDAATAARLARRLPVAPRNAHHGITTLALEHGRFVAAIVPTGKGASTLVVAPRDTEGELRAEVRRLRSAAASLPTSLAPGTLAVTTSSGLRVFARPSGSGWRASFVLEDAPIGAGLPAAAAETLLNESSLAFLGPRCAAPVASPVATHADPLRAAVGAVLRAAVSPGDAACGDGDLVLAVRRSDGSTPADVLLAARAPGDPSQDGDAPRWSVAGDPAAWPAAAKLTATTTATAIPHDAERLVFAGVVTPEEFDRTGRPMPGVLHRLRPLVRSVGWWGWSDARAGTRPGTRGRVIGRIELVLRDPARRAERPASIPDQRPAASPASATAR